MDIAIDGLSSIVWAYLRREELESLVDFVLGADAFEFYKALSEALNTHCAYRELATYLLDTFRCLYWRPYSLHPDLSRNILQIFVEQ